jgi:hypothetical protein
MALFLCIGDLLASVERWLSRADEQLEAREYRKIRSVIYDSGEASDEYSTRLNAAIQGIEVVIRRLLKL